MLDISKVIHDETTEELTLTIYYLGPFSLTRFPVSKELLLESFHDYKIVIEGDALKNHIDLLRRMSETELIAIEYNENDIYLEARMHLIFEISGSSRTFEVTMWGISEEGHYMGILVNEKWVESKQVFYDILLQFLPEHLADEIRSHLKNRLYSY